MGGRRWPTVLEACGQVARRQLVSQVAQKEQDVPARLVRERSKDSLGVGCRGPSHANERLAFRVTISKMQNKPRWAVSKLGVGLGQASDRVGVAGRGDGRTSDRVGLAGRCEG